MMKDEAPYLIEWVAHHLAVGFTDILVYTNDCTDGTDDMLIRLQELGLGHHRRNVIPEGRKPQPSAIKHAQDEPIVQQADWVLLFDADEFLCINYGDGRIDSLLDAAGEANGVVITWRIFGSSGVVDWSRAPVTEQYQRAAPTFWNKGWGVKTLFKHDAHYWKLGIHRPKIKAKHLKTDFPDSVRWLNGSGVPMEDYFKFRGWRSIRRTVGYDWAQMNHYAVKSIDAYAVRKFRGNVNLKADKYNADYWALQDRNEVRDTAILRYASKRTRIAAELLKDPVLNRLHHAALERVEAQLAVFKQTEDYETLKESLIAASQVPLAKVNAKPPKARDPAKIAALMSEVEQTAAARPKSERRNRPAPEISNAAFESACYVARRIDRTGDIMVEQVANHGIILPADPRVFSAEALEEVRNGKFDRRHARHLPGLINDADRLLVLGAGVCFLPVLACLEKPGLIALAHEPHTDLARFGREIAAAQDLASDRLKIIDGPLFFPTEDPTKTASGLRALVEDFRPSVIFLDDPRILPEALATALTPAVKRVMISTRLDSSLWPGELTSIGVAASVEPHKSGILVLERARA
ncbi:glycosyltransferase family 2 protein [uncultured Roseobacter sp.]|uniref:glycosyltransferase family 2 protein n=1 Tax=uncultured Roseobacter sp. TaxID=114847 RepID=UPI00262B0469|nr:glycosyltransferase family 2 protein [uncultured Roseobacter sp.]